MVGEVTVHIDKLLSKSFVLDVLVSCRTIGLSAGSLPGVT